MKSLSFYIHIPFCIKKCNYCDFVSYSNYESLFDLYINSLIYEIIKSKTYYLNYEIKSIFFGGGTPSIINSEYIRKILNTIFNNFTISNDIEITIEINPKTIDLKKLKVYKEININRLSFGVQAWQNNILSYLGRVHNIEDFVKNFYQAREIGFNNISVDIMFSLPNQTLQQWEETLKNIIDLNLEHISIYSLIIEKGTYFYKLYNEGLLNCCNEDLDREMYYLAKSMLEYNSYIHYEISNFAKDGFECYHNKVYWNCNEYIGYGLGAHSYFKNQRYHNTYDINKYLSLKNNFNIIKEDLENLSIEDMYAEYIFMGLRMMRGISKKEFFKKFNKNIYDIYKKEIEYLKSFDLIYENNDSIILTNKGIDISNVVFEKFIV